MNNKTAWIEYKNTLESYVIATDAGTDAKLIYTLAARLKALETLLVERTPEPKVKSVKINLYRPTVIVKAFESCCF